MKKRKTILIICICVFLLSIIAFGAYILPPLLSGDDTSPDSSYNDVSSETSEPEPELADNPIDFKTLKEQSPDIYAWIKVPGTKVDYPVLRSNDKPENFYLDHDENGKYRFAGCIYSQMYNSDDFTDPNTILYGHNMNNGSMFASLHSFRKASFFNENEYIYIYTPGHILTYRIYAAYRYDNRHLLYAFDFSDKQVFADYIEMTKNPKSTIVNVRRDVEVTADDRIITLSTCITNSNYRYLVQGVLVDDTLTK
jgi:sortase B